jgi:hypothetical protein
MDCVSIKTRVKEFDVRHGEDSVVFNVGWLLFGNGAMREINPMGPLIEPPEDNYKRAKLVVRYHEIKLNLAAEEFNLLKHNLKLHAKVGLKERFCPPPPPQEEIERLKQLKKKVQKWQRKLEKSHKELENSKPAQLVERDKTNEGNRRANEDLLGEVERIEV